MAETTAHYSANTLQVVHATPGRVRLRPANAGNNKLDTSTAVLEKVAQKLRQQKGISEVFTNPTTHSVVATFDPSTLPLPQVLEILQHSGASPSSGLVQSHQKAELLQGLNSDTLLQEYPRIAKSIVPLIVGMLLTNALGIQGLMAFPVFMIADRVTAEAIKALESEFLPSDGHQSSLKASTVLNGNSGAVNGNGKSEHSLMPTQLNGHAATVNGNGKVKTSHQEVTYSIVHNIRGRMRFRIPRLAQDAEYCRRLEVLAQSDPQITDIRINSTAASVAIAYNASTTTETQMRSHLASLFQSAGDATILLPASASHEQQSEAETNLWSNLALPAVTATLALLGGPLGVPIPPIVIGGTIAVTALPVAQRALDSIITEQRLNIDFLDLAAITITTLQGQFINPAIMLVLIEFGEAIREQTARSSKKQTLDLLDSLKQLVWVERDGEKHEISIHEVKPGDVVIVYPGDQIPVDGQILRGKALIDEQKLTGESMPVMRKKGQHVYTSTLVREGQLYILAEKVGAETRAGQIIKVMQDAPVHDTRVENYAAKIADQAVLPTLLMSGIMFGATGNLARAAAILTIDFATGIRVSVPTTVLAALTYAARHGILIRSGRALEKLASVDAVVFDKTGTLTQGEPIVVSVETVSESTSPLKVLELAAAAEQRLTHPVAAAVVRYAQEKGARILPRGKWKYEIGLGVRAEIDGQTILVGSDRFLQQEGIHLDTLREKYPHLNGGSHSVIYVASNSELQGAIAYRDPLRPESRKVIHALRSSASMEIHLLTGDNQRTASAVAHELGIATTNTHAEAFPEKKVAVVKALHEEGRTVAFVGDGINDSPALAYADVSVSFRAGSDVARETADVVLMEDNLHGLPEAIAIARQAMQLIHQNTAIVAVPNLAALVLAVAVGIDPLAATLVNNGTAILAGLNGLRPLLTSSEELDILAANLDASSRVQESENLPLLEAVTNGTEPIPEIRTDTATLVLEQNSPKSNFFPTPEVVTNGKNQPLTLETSIETSSSVAVMEVLTPVAKETETLSGRALAHRLNVSASTISKRKSKPDFSQWSGSKDPQGMTWIYLPESQLFAPA